MKSRIDSIDQSGRNHSPNPNIDRKPPGIISILVLSAWCGLVAGLLEVAAIVVRKEVFDANHLYGISRHFVWLIPLCNLAIFLVLGLLGGLVSVAWKPRGWWLFKRGLCTLGLLPAVLIAFPRIYTLAWLAVTMGMAARIVPVLEWKRDRFRRTVLYSFPAALAILVLLGGSLWLSDHRKQAGERARSLPRRDSPNVMLIVLDTVAAGHLSLYGYERPTSTTLVELAGGRIRFDSARAASSWTLPSHATMFTGRWLHELSVGWLNPLDEGPPTLAGYLGENGYATAGFVANTMFCASDTGLGRGFTRYQDFVFPSFTALKSAILAQRTLAVFGRLLPIVEERPSLAWLRPHVQEVWQSFVFDRKGAATVNREVLEWLSRRTEPERPFFAFLNYSDAHTPYELPAGRIHRFGTLEPDERQREVIRRWGDLDKVRIAPSDLPFVVDAYDDCVADLDEQVGRLIDRLSRRGLLDRTWLIVVADHGESFGEHPGVFCHGTSLYQTELHVPLLIVPPGAGTPKRVVKETVSLRNLAATIVDLVGLDTRSPFPGSSLAHYWRDPAPSGPKGPALSEVVPGLAINVDAYGLPQKSWPLGALDDGDWSYIRGQDDAHEELFHLRNDVKQQRNLARDPTARPILDGMRQTLEKLTGGPLTPDRFNR